MIRNFLIGIITVFLAAVLAAGLLITGRQDSAKAAELESINTKLRKNGYVISDLEEELAAIEKKIEDESACPATQQLILLDLTPEMVESLAPMITGNGGVGILALSEGKFPGDEGMITQERFNALVDQGFTVCYYWTGEGEFPVWLFNMLERSLTDGLPLPEAVLFDEGTFLPGMEPFLRANNITCVCTIGGEETDDYRASYSDIWKVSAKAWDHEGAEEELAAIVSEGGNGAYVFGGRFEAEAPFKSAGKKFDSDKEYGELLLTTDFMTARKLHKEAYEIRQDLIEENREHTAELEEQLEEARQTKAQLERGISDVVRKK